MATGAAGGDGIFRGMFEGCISGGDMGIQRRPYHRNCGCALHKSRGHCSHSSKHSLISYPIRRSWSEGCLSVIVSGSQHYSPSSSPAVAPHESGLGLGLKSASRSNLVSLNEEEEEEDELVLVPNKDLKV